MQDKDFKKEIDNQTITFASWDNITVIFDVKWEIKSWVMQNKSIYIKKVENFNEAIIEHISKKSENKDKYKPQGLFENDEII